MSPPPVMVAEFGLGEAELFAPVLQDGAADREADAGGDEREETRPEEDLVVRPGRGGAEAGAVLTYRLRGEELGLW